MLCIQEKSVENEASTDDSPKENGETTSRAKKTKTAVKKAPKKTVSWNFLLQLLTNKFEHLGTCL